MNKLIIVIAGIIIAILVGSVAAQYLQTITNNHTGTISNPQSAINIFYNNVNKTDGSAVNWTELLGVPFHIGQNRLNLNVTNVSDKYLIIRLFVKDLDPSFTFTWGPNNTAIDGYGTMAVADCILRIPDTVIDGTTLDWNIEVTATQVPT